MKFISGSCPIFIFYLYKIGPTDMLLSKIRVSQLQRCLHEVISLAEIAIL